MALRGSFMVQLKGCAFKKEPDAWYQSSLDSTMVHRGFIKSPLRDLPVRRLDIGEFAFLLCNAMKDKDLYNTGIQRL